MGQLVFQATLGGQVNLVGPNTASTYNINVPAVAGNMVTTGDTGTVTNTMCATSVYTAPGTIGSGTPNTGAFTTLSASTSVTTPIVKSASSLTLQTNGTTTAVTIDTSQNVGIGTGSPAGRLDVKGTANGTQAIFTNVSGRGLLVSTQSVAGTDDAGSVLNARGATSGTLIFQTDSTERARIDSSGNLLVGTTSSSPSDSNSTYYSIAGKAAVYNHATGTSSGQQFIGFAYAGTYIGSISQNGTTGVLYNLTSDYRLKNDPQLLTGAKEFVMALQPKKWQWWDGSGEGVGFIAHEFMEVAKYSGNGEKDAVDADGNPIYQSIQPSSSEVMANLVSLLQEQQAIIEQLKADVAELKAPQ